MRLICLNVEGGKHLTPLIEYIEKESARTDFFCFQEVLSSELREEFLGGFRTDIYQKIMKALPEFNGYFSPMVTNRDFIRRADFKGFDLRTDFLVESGLAIFARKNISIVGSDSEFMYRKKGYKPVDIYGTPRIAQCLLVEIRGKRLSIFNFHGLLDKGHKRDTETRTEQFSKLSRFLDTFSYPKILCGDFNTRPEAQCFGMLEKNMENLVKTRGITATRNRLYADMERYADYISDYMLVSPEIKVADFKVPQIEVADHLPLVLDFSV